MEAPQSQPAKLGDLSLFGQAALDMEQFRVFLLGRNPASRPYAAGLVNRYYEQQETWGLRADLLLAQCFHETGVMTSWWSQKPRRNLCGLGVTGQSLPPGQTPPAAEAGQWVLDAASGTWYKGLVFATFEAAVSAHYAHMWAYVGAFLNNPDLDARAAVADKYRFSGARAIAVARAWHITTPNGLAGRWAVPGVNYGASIEAMLNAVAAYVPPAGLDLSFNNTEF